MASNSIQLIKLRPNRRYEVEKVARSQDISLLLHTKKRAWLDDMRHSSICSQYNYPYYESLEDMKVGEMEETKPSWHAWKPKETVLTLDGQSEILSTDTSLRDEDLDERRLQDNQRSRLTAALSQFAINAIEATEAKGKRNDFILTVLTFALLLAVCILAIVFAPAIMDRAGDLTSGFGGGSLPFLGGDS